MKVLKYKEGFLYRTPSGAVAEYILHETGCLLFRCMQTSITHVFTIKEAYDVNGYPRFEEVGYTSITPVLQEDGSYKIKTIKHKYGYTDESNNCVKSKQVQDSEQKQSTGLKYSPSLKHSHYFKDVSKLDKIDVYSVLALFEVTDPCIQHALKKLLCTGKRGHKDFNKDVQDAIDSLVRCQELCEELNQAKE